MARETYFTSKFGQGELKLVRKIDDDSTKGITPADIGKADKDAFDKVNVLILDLAGNTQGATIIAEFTASADAPVDPMFTRLGELAAAHTILALWEEYNYGTERNRDTDTSRGQLEAERVAREIKNILTTLQRTKSTVKADNTVRTFGFKPGSMGPVVLGPLTKGSYFDYTKYVDAWGLQHDPLQKDPYQTGS